MPPRGGALTLVIAQLHHELFFFCLVRELDSRNLKVLDVAVSQTASRCFERAVRTTLCSRYGREFLVALQEESDVWVTVVFLLKDARNLYEFAPLICQIRKWKFRRSELVGKFLRLAMVDDAGHIYDDDRSIRTC